ncbi:hypothetical protein BOW52_07785 [Solemya elarraichensis gill symbiont]|uniref:Uncharacterized protein n=1 Tax=Solemya elarraichensis gill symbiont TaxID=1918949 RepID=A0A1T2L1M8_9GAMM|nr:hypothetical protein BOW52_07785 [Solemya elarraichensis gill symbiont]
MQTDGNSRSYWQIEVGGYPETEPSSRTGIKLAVAETRGEGLRAINQRALTDHHCGRTRHQSVHAIEGRNIHAEDVG